MCKRKINQRIVKDLLDIRKSKNFMLRGTTLVCDLVPKKGVEPCSICDAFTKCCRSKKEREYIIEADL